MTQKHDLEAENFDKPARKRVRDNHNELERVRRNHQKAQLEALRIALPFQDMDEKASMVRIFVRAREYIMMLEQRVMELQSVDANGGGVNPSLSYKFSSPQSNYSSPIKEAQYNAQNQPPQLPQYFKNPQYQPQPIEAQFFHKSSQPEYTPSIRERNMSINPDRIQIHHGVSFFNPGIMSPIPVTVSAPDSSFEMISPPPSRPSINPMRKASSSPLSDPSLNADLLRNFVSDNFLRAGSSGVSRRLSSNEEISFMRTFNQRRSSSLLMPFEGETVMIQKRDSFSSLFSGLIPDFVDSNTLENNDLKCSHCQKGMCNMIMIDCDKCRRWYHIKCVKIDSDAIPTHWCCC